MKNYYYILFTFIFISCNSGGNQEGQVLKEIKVNDSFTTSLEKIAIQDFKTDKVISKTNTNNQIEELIVYTEKGIQNFVADDYVIIYEQGNYVIINNSNVKVLNTNNSKTSTDLFKTMRHYFEATNILGEEVLSVYTSDSCTSSGIDQDGKELSKTYKFDQVLDKNLNQFITETPTHFYIYKLDLKNWIIF